MSRQEMLARTIVVLALLVLAAFVSWQLVSALALFGMGALATWQAPRLRTYSWTLPLALLLLLSLVTLILGIPGWVAGVIALLVSMSVLLVSWRRRALASFTPAAFWGAVGLAAIPVSTLALATAVNRSAAISWVMMGDGFEWIRYLGDLRALGPFEVITSGLFPRLTMSTELLAQTVLVPGTGVAGLLADVQANVAWVVLALIAATADLLRTFGGRPRGPIAFGQGLVVSLVMCSTLIIGLVAANGFLSVAPTIVLVVLGLLAVDRVLRRGDHMAIWVAVIASLALVTSWQPFALVTLGLLVAAVLVRGIPAIRRWWPVIAGAVIVILMVGAVLVTTGSVTAAGAGHFPATPLAALLLALVALLAVSARTRARGMALLVSVAFAAGSLAAFITLRGGDIWGLLASIHSTGVTPFYYVQKFIWIAAAPAVLLLAVVLVSPSSVRRLGRRTSAFACAVLVAAGFTAAQVPNLPWLPLGSRSDIQELGDLVLDPTVTLQPRLFVGFQAPHVDAVINAWDGLLWERYLRRESLGERPGAAWRDAVISAYEGGNLAGAACAAANIVDGPLTIVTGQPTLESEAGSVCADQLADVTFEFRVDRGV